MTQDVPARSGALRSLGNRILLAATRFPVAYAAFAIAAIAFSIASLNRGDTSLLGMAASAARAGNEALEDVGIACVTGAVASVVAQLVAERRGIAAARVSWQLVAGLVAGCAIAACHVLLSDDRGTLWEMIFLAAFLVPLFLGLWLLYDERNEEVLLPVLASGFLFALFLAGVLMVGLAAVYEAFQALVFETRHGWYDPMLCLCWVLVFPGVFLAQVPQTGDVPDAPRAWRAIVGYVAFPVCLLLLAVLYLYMGRIAITRSMPSGEMNWYGSFALFVWLCLWMGLRMVRNAPGTWFVRWGWALLVPVVLVQLYGVHVRLSAYGLTPLRYASLACTLVGIVGLVLAARGRGPRDLCLVAAIAAAVVLVSPANALDAANMSQAYRLQAVLDRLDAQADLTEDEVSAAQGAWEYLRYASRGYLEPDAMANAASMSSGQLDEVLGPHAGAVHADEAGAYRYIWADAVELGVDVSEYSTVWPLGAYIDGCWVAEDGTVTATIVVDANGERTLDLTGLAHQAQEGTLPGEGLEGGDHRLPDGGIAIDLDDGSRVIITSLGVEEQGGGIVGVDVDGYLLVP